MTMINYTEIKARYGGQICALRRQLHENAEPSGAERETLQIIRRALAPLLMEELPLPAGAGAAFRLRGGKKGETILLRADIDALAVTEPEENIPRSTNRGYMHACGHDIHAAGLYGAALALADRLESLRGDVVLLFQSAEETMEGAKRSSTAAFWSSRGCARPSRCTTCRICPWAKLELPPGLSWRQRTALR